ncbi:hypothetical protein HOLleu_15600 [Holothuria leucospilota]|uniref:Uncharacterized protein n=1 Tax=Holothuria leucospilota TaxID=206669 RepID=A0A9Q1HAI5_HOLLE|nr:hypothetical protein HOLleu_15600 [Holothuria leucospilota]
MVIDYRKYTTRVPTEVIIKESVVESVSTYKYLGIVTDDQIAWHDHIDYLVKKVSPRLYCLRKLNNFNINSVVCWGGNVDVTDKKRIDSVIKQAGRILGDDQFTIYSSYQHYVVAKLNTVLNGTSHPLYADPYSAIISGSGRMKLPYAVTKRQKLSFILQCIKPLATWFSNVYLSALSFRKL